MLTARILYDRGVAASSAGRFGTARRYLTTAEERSDDAELTALIHVSQAYVEAESGAPAQALELCEEALSSRELSSKTRGVALSQRGLIRARLGDSAGALKDLSSALDVIGEDPILAGRAYLNRGALHLQNGDADQARDDFEDVRRVLESPDVDANYDKAGFNLGYAHLMRGELVEALRLMDEVAPRLSQLGPVYQATILQDRSEVLIAAGLARQGATALADAAHAYGVRRLRQFQAQAELSRARTLLHLDPKLSARIARQASRRFAGRGSSTWALRADAVALMATVAQGGRARSLVESADALSPALRREGLAAEATLVDLYAARVLIRRDELESARARVHGIRVTQSTPIGTRLMFHEVKGDLARARGQRQRSFAHILEGLGELHAWQSSFGSLDLQSGVVGHGRQLAVDGLRMAIEDGRPELVFEWSERARALVGRVVPVRPPADEKVTAELAEVRWLHAQQPDPRSREGRRLAKLQESMRQHAWYGGGSGQVTEPCSMADLSAALGPDNALVAYVVSTDRLVALVVTDTEARVIDLGKRDRLKVLMGGLFPDLDMAGGDLPAAFAAPIRRQLAARLDQLAEVLVAPLLNAIGDRRLVLTPSGVLAGLPWGLVPGLVGRPLTVAKSATTWLSHRVEPLRVRTAGFVAGPRVARAEGEVRAAAAVWPESELLLGDDATAAAVSDLAARVDVLHVSAHGRHSSENPLFSGVELVDGPWFGYDIDQLTEVPDVVLLSACEVGRSQVRYGEELVGMTTAWLHAGARCVIASAAAVNDVIADEVLVAVHRGLGAGLDPAAALAAAVPAVTSDAPPAPFVCFC